MKFSTPDITKLQALIKRRAELNTSSDECSRMLTEQEALNQRLLDDAKLGDDGDVAELAHGRTRADILRAKLPRIKEQLASLDTELAGEAKSHGLAGERFAGELLQFHRRNVENAIAPFVPRVRVELLSVTDPKTGALGTKPYDSSSAFDRVVESVLLDSEIAIQIRRHTPRVSYDQSPLDAAGKVVSAVQGLAAIAKKFNQVA